MPSPDREGLILAAFEDSPLAVLHARRVAGRATTILGANAAAARLVGRPGDQLVGTDLREILLDGVELTDQSGVVGRAVRVRAPATTRDAVPGDEDSGADGPGGDWSGEDTVEPESGGPERWLAVSITPLTEAVGGGGSGTVLVVLFDVTAQIHSEQRLDQAARHDPLTGLINRAELLRLIGDLDPGHDGPYVAAVFIDLDGFKLVNDTRGHLVGDGLLIAVSQRIRSAIRGVDRLARIGGDEFVILCPRLLDPIDVQVVAEQVRATLDTPVTVEGRAHRITMSLGVATSTIDEVDPADLLRRADMAMYRAKESGRNRVRLHSVDMDAELVEAERIREALEVALAIDGDGGSVVGLSRLVLHYQPIVTIDSGQIAYVEALARLSLADGQLVYPSDFLRVAARAGLNGALSERVLRDALRQRAKWRELGMDTPIGLNLTRGQVASASFASDALRMIGQEQAAAGGVVFEMDEFGLLEATGPAQLTLRRLRTAGIGLAIDHFGTGYSSLGALRFLGPHRVKIDRSFVASIGANLADRAIVSAAISAAHSLGQRVVAEGVENREQLDVLAGLGCDEVQGFLLARVVPAEQVRLDQWRWHPRTLTPSPG